MLLKAISTAVVTLLLSFTAQAQMAEPVNWSFTATKISLTEFQITLTASIDEGWYVYSQEMVKKGPVPTKIDFDQNPNIIPVVENATNTNVNNNIQTNHVRTSPNINKNTGGRTPGRRARSAGARGRSP